MYKQILNKSWKTHPLLGKYLRSWHVGIKGYLWNSPMNVRLMLKTHLRHHELMNLYPPLQVQQMCAFHTSRYPYHLF